MCMFNLFNFLNIECGKIEYDSQVAELKVFSLYMLFLPFSLQNLNGNRWILQKYLAIIFLKIFQFHKDVSDNWLYW